MDQQLVLAQSLVGQLSGQGSPSRQRIRPGGLKVAVIVSEIHLCALAITG